MADSQIIYTEMVAEWKTEKTYLTVRKQNIGVPPKKKTYPLACVLRRGMLKGMLTPCVRIASDPPCFYCSLPSAWKGGCAQSGFQGYALGYALGMLCVCFLASIQLYTLWVRGIHPSTDPEAYPLIIPRSGPRKHSMFSWRRVGLFCFDGTPMFLFD